MEANKEATERHENEVNELINSSPTNKLNYWERFYNSDDYKFLVNSVEIGRIGIIAEFIILSYKNPAVLDIGCGIGFLKTVLNSFECQYFGFDISEKALQIASSQNTGEFITLDAESIQFKNYYPDVIVFSEILYYTDNRTILDNAYKALKKSGSIFISIFISPSGNKIIEEITSQYKISQSLNVTAIEANLSWRIIRIVKD